ncbi:hypothetical protein ACQQ2N_11845 [Dokdonella sp. MW10]|uniref:hypothetical protein n=1 Tax=Dokdonella sp. MW10 TaxID=2992926 RepID=UPI003F804917
MKAWRVTAFTVAIVFALALAALWWKHGSSLFLSSLGAMICAEVPLHHDRIA